MATYRIPQIGDRRLTWLCLKIVPLMRFKNVGTHSSPSLVNSYELGRNPVVDDLYYLQATTRSDPRKTFVTRRPSKPASGLREVARANILTTIQSNFLPSEAEVLAQVPQAFVSAVTCFEVIPDENRRLEQDGRQAYRRAIAIFYAPEEE